MRTNFVVPATNGTYLSPPYNVYSKWNFDYNVTFEFYNDEALTEPSTGMTGTITVNGKESANSIWANIPDTSIPSTINAATAYSLAFKGIVYQLQIINASLANTNYVNIIVDSNPSS